jgi:2-polyprenyl-3-methyl-5-hydroxy-6-metoxy-1,4-benzoquinol methylase
MLKLPLAHRHQQPELMDQPDLNVGEHRRALSGLRRLNLASGVCRQLWKQLTTHNCIRTPRSLRMLDIASGGGDVPLGLWKLARRSGVDLRILGLDISSVACEYATERCRVAAGSITFEQADVTSDALPKGFDVVTCSLFLHHLSFAQASTLLKKMAAAGHFLLVSDLRRSALGYALAQLACHLLTTSGVVHCDGPRSVASAFTLAELRELCSEADLEDATIRAVWPSRVLVTRRTR